MNFTTGRNLTDSSIFIRYDGSFTKTGSLFIYESKFIDSISIVTFSSIFIDNVRQTKQILPNDFNLTTLVDTYIGLIPIQRYTVFCNSISDIKIISAHYGNLYAGGIEFDLTKVIASTNDDYAYMITMYVYDLPLLLSYSNFGYKITQNLTFDIADYSENRRIYYETVLSNNQFSKLGISLTLIDNELQVSCSDTAGKSASTHIMMNLGLSETTLQCVMQVTVSGFNEIGETILKYSNIIANSDYSDNTISYFLPRIDKDIVVCKISVSYIITVNTMSTDIVLHSNLVLTDQQLANLRPAKLSDLT